MQTSSQSEQNYKGFALVVKPESSQFSKDKRSLGVFEITATHSVVGIFSGVIVYYMWKAAPAQWSTHIKTFN